MALNKNTYANILKAGTQAAYEAIQTKDNSVLYFCTDTGKIYKGSTDFTNSVVLAASKPDTPIVGKLYVLADTNTVEVYVGGAWKVVSYPTATTIDVNSDDVHVATAKAVYDAITDAVADLAGSENTIKSIGKGDTDGSIKITKGDDSASDLTIDGVVTTPTWNSDTRVLTLPVNGGAAVEVNIGKDIFLDPAKEQKYNPDTKCIELYLNDGTGEKEATKISIPAESLVNDYTVGDTATVALTLGDDHKITAAVKLSDDIKNAIVVDGEKGLMVDLSAYALTDTVDSQIATVTGLANAAQAKADANEAAITILNGDANTAGSVDAKVKVAKDAADAAQAKADANADDIATLDYNLNALANATTVWGTF